MIKRKRVVVDQFQFVGEKVRQFRQRRQAAFVSFDSGHIRTRLQQSARQSAGAGAYFEYRLPVEFTGDRSNLVEKLHVEQEILAQRLARGQPVFLDHLPQRGQGNMLAQWP